MSGKKNAYRLTPAAENDLEEIWFYSFQKWSASQADRYHKDIVTAFEMLASKQWEGRSVDIREGYLKYPVGSHMLFFKTDDAGTITIVRILHQQMDVGKHL